MRSALSTCLLLSARPIWLSARVARSARRSFLDGRVVVNVDHAAALVLVGRVGEGRVPLNGLGGGARDRRAAGDGGLDAVAVAIVGEVRVEDGAEVEGLLGGGRVVREARARRLQVEVGDDAVGVGLEAVDPRVTDAIGELLLLAPEHVIGEEGLLGHVEGGAHEPLFEVLRGLALGDHLVLARNLHGRVEHVLVEEGHADLEAVGHRRLVGTQAVVLAQVVHLAHALLVQLRAVGRLVEVEVAGEGLVGALARHDHLDAHRLDLAREEEHGRARAYGGHVVRLQVVDDVRDGVDALVDCEREAVVLGPDKFGHRFRGRQVGAALQSNGEGLDGLKVDGVTLHEEALPLESGDDGGAERRVETAREEDAIRHVGHHALGHGIDEGVAQLLEVVRRARHVVTPRGVVVAHEGPGATRLARVAAAARVVMARREHLHVDAARLHQRLGLRRKPRRAIEPGAPVERVDANRVSRRVQLARLLVHDRERKVAVECRRDVDANLLIEVHDRLAVRVGAEARLIAHLRAQLLIVVDLAIDRERQLPVLRVQRLVARERVHDREPLVRDRRGRPVRVLHHVDAAAVGSAVANQALECERLQLERLLVLLCAADRKDAAHLSGWRAAD
mmetsp:Transcript_47141/g.124201  ORF Transcript_47141/g.124201 Transcript_47141/m.124201 type:complete len:620 (-) Transcript_47141:169-2028(-)